MLFCTAIIVSASAQIVTGSFMPLKEQSRAKLIIDFSDANIMGMTEKEFSEYEEDWEHDSIEIFSLFYNYANKALARKLVLGNYNSDTEYIIHLIVRTIDVRGDYDSDVILIHNNKDGSQEIIAKAENLYARGGTFGTKLNLMKDGAEHTGTALGKFLKKQLF